jgi:hypothetical protein
MASGPGQRVWEALARLRLRLGRVERWGVLLLLGTPGTTVVTGLSWRGAEEDGCG